MTVRELISDKIFPLKPEDTVKLGIHMMEENKVSHLPVVKQGKYLGLIAEQPLYAVGDEKLKIEELSHHFEPLFIYDTQHAYEALKLVSGFKLSVLPVVSDIHQYLGVIILSDLVRKFADSISVTSPGTVIVLEIGQRDYSMEEIARIVESNDAKILSAIITSSPDTMLMDVTIKINKLDASAVLQTFTRFNYLVKASFGEDDEQERLKERYDALMRFINI
ncbi:MAG: CBS domain-containing protein [Bacteroidales bacterium]|nr:CBS domain-containing protein [Bacteroidales bacterium]